MTAATTATMTAARENFADILCIGAQRSMTSWLHHVLAAHPGTWTFPNFNPVTSTSKEAHFWDWNRDRGLDWYRFLMTPLDDRSLKSMDFTPEYALMSDAEIAECRRINPGARVIYILRDPLCRAVSALRMHTLWRSRNAPADKARIVFDEGFMKLAEGAKLWSHAAYTANAARWRRHYPDLLVLNFEALAADPEAGLSRVLAHCALPEGAMNDAQTLTLRQRAGKRLWETPAYPVDPDALHYLHGALWAERRAAEAEFGFAFTEAEALLTAARGAA